MEITDIYLMEKIGGKSGVYRRPGRPQRGNGPARPQREAGRQGRDGKKARKPSENS
jgi:hypothetical protein